MGDYCCEEEDNSLERYIQSENLFLVYLKSVIMVTAAETAASGTVAGHDQIVASHQQQSEDDADARAAGFDELDNLLAFLCDRIYEYPEIAVSTADPSCGEGAAGHESGDVRAVAQKFCDRPFPERKAKRCAPFHAKESSAKPQRNSRGRSHSSVDVDEIMRSQTIADINSSADLNRKSTRRVSLGMKPRFSSNWYKVKEAFKRDKSYSRLDSKDSGVLPSSCDNAIESGDEVTAAINFERSEPHSSSSHDNATAQLSSEDDEEFEYYTEALFPIDSECNRYFIAAADGDEYPIDNEAVSIVQDEYGLYPEVYENASRVSRRRRTDTSSGENCSNDDTRPYKYSQILLDDDVLFKLTDNNETALNNAEAASRNISRALREIQERYESLQNQLSIEFNRKYNDDHEKTAKRFIPYRDGNNSDQNPTTSLDSKVTATTASSAASSFHRSIERNFSPTFKQRFQEWQRLKGISLSPTRAKIATAAGADKSNSPNLQKKQQKCDWHKWRPGSKSESNVLRFLESSKEPDEFGRERVPSYHDEESDPNYSGAPKKQSLDILRGKCLHGDKKKELAWLEKELQKVAREKHRLEKEKEKYAERENRLQNMKRAIKSGGRKRKQEVLVPTSTGLFRFQGISSKFTRKLYEWEKARGISAESSTFAFLDPRYSADNVSRIIQRYSSNQPSEKIGSLSRSRSMGSVDIACGPGSGLQHSVSLSHQQSSLSLNDVEQLEEAHLQVTDDNLMRSSVQLFSDDKENDEGLLNDPEIIETDLMGESSFAINDHMNCSDKIQSEYGTTDDYSRRTTTIDSIGHLKKKLFDEFDSDSYRDFNNLHSVSSSEIHPLSLEQKKRKSANEDVINITNQIEQLRAGTSVDDKDRMDTLSRLQVLAETLLIMVKEMNDRKSENADEFAQICTLALELKEEIRKLSNDKLATTSTESMYCEVANEAMASEYSKVVGRQHEESTEKDSSYAFASEGTYSDLEDIDSPTVHCTFTLPAWRVKYATPSSTDSDSYSVIRKKSGSAVGGKQKRERNNSRPDADDNYDGEDETTSRGRSYRRESSENTSASNSDLACKQDETDDVEVTAMRQRRSSTSSGGSEEKRNVVLVRAQNYHLSRNNNNDSGAKKDNDNYSDEDYPRDDSELAIAGGYESPRLGSKKKCPVCGKVKKLIKGKKPSNGAGNAYCLCGTARKEQQQKERTFLASGDTEDNGSGPKSEDASDEGEDQKKMGQIARSKVFEFYPVLSESASPASVRRESDSRGSGATPVNVIVPTTRTIFAPVQQDENGNLSTVVSYTVNEEECVKRQPLIKISSNGRLRDDENEGGAIDCGNGSAAVDVTSGDKNASLLMPPSWTSSKEARSKSVSPSIGRKESLFSESVVPEGGSSIGRRDDATKLEKSPGNLAAIAGGGRRLFDGGKLPPASPLARRPSKETSSSIKMMIARYNKLTSERKPPMRRASEGNCWSSNNSNNSPVLERKAQFEQWKSGNKSEDKTIVRKSRSAVLNKNVSSSSQPTLDHQSGPLPADDSVVTSSSGITKSSSVGVINISPLRVIKSIDLQDDNETANQIGNGSNDGDVSPNQSTSAADEGTPDTISVSGGKIDLLISTAYRMPREKNPSLENILQETKLRSMRLQEAREKFFNEHLVAEKRTEQDDRTDRSDKSSPDPVDDAAKSEISVEQSDDGGAKRYAEPNYNAIILNKSISTGAINDRVHSVPSNLPVSGGATADHGKNHANSKTGKFGLSSIASRFRRVKMRRHHKDSSTELSTVSSLCRASLLLNIDKDNKDGHHDMAANYPLSTSKSCPSSPVALHRKSNSKRNSSSN